MSLAPDHREELTGRSCLHHACLAALLCASAGESTSQGMWGAARKGCLTRMPASEVNCISVMALKKNWIVAFGECFRQCRPLWNKLQGEGKEGKKVQGENEVPSARASARWGYCMYTWGSGTWQLDPQLWFLNSNPLASYFFCLVSYCQHWQPSSLILPLIVLHVTELKWIKSKCFSWSIR